MKQTHGRCDEDAIPGFFEQVQCLLIGIFTVIENVDTRTQTGAP